MTELLVERETAVKELDEFLAMVAAGHGCGLILEGPPGIGKTTLLDVAEELAAHHDLATFRAVGNPLGTDYPWSTAKQLLASLGLPDLDALGDQAAYAAAPGGASYQSVTRLFDHIAGLAQSAPMILLIDDAQWADLETMQLVAYALGRIPGRGIGILMTTRSGSTGRDELDRILRRIRATTLADVRRVPTLSEDGVARLVRSRFPTATSSFCGGVHVAAGGNPYLCEELLKAAHREQIPPTDVGAQKLVRLSSDGIRRFAVDRIEQLGAAATEVAAAVAILGARASTGLIRAMIDQPDEVAIEAIDQAVRAGLLQAGDGSLSFAHPIMGETVGSDLGPARKAALHRRAANLLHASADPTEIAVHLQAAGAPWPEWSWEVFRDAGQDCVSSGALDTAVRMFESALDAGPPGPVRGELLVALGRAEAATGRATAAEHLQQAAELLDRQLPDTAVLTELGEALYAAGRYPESIRAFERGLISLTNAGKHPDRNLLDVRLEAGIFLAGTISGIGSATIARYLTDQPDVAQEAHDLPTRVVLALEAGKRALGVGVAPELHRHDQIEPLTRAALTGTPIPPEVGLMVLEPLALSLYLTRQLDQASTLLDHLISTITDQGQLHAFASLLTVRALVRLHAGALPDAIGDATEALRLATDFPDSNSHAEMVARNVLVQAAVSGADPRAAADAIDVPDAEIRWGGHVMYAWFLDALGLEALNRRDYAAAYDAFQLTGHRMKPIGDSAGLIQWRLGAARAAKGLGLTAESRRLAEEEYERAKAFGTPVPLAQALQLRGLMSSVDDAVPLLQEALELPSVTDCPLVWAALQVDLGAALRRKGSRSEARRRLRSGLAEASRNGATALVSRAEEELSAAGAKRIQRPVQGPLSLTSAEQRVAKLAAQGFSNREIAVELFLSRKTVEVHLSTCYRKLGISQRSELAAHLIGTE